MLVVGCVFRERGMDGWMDGGWQPVVWSGQNTVGSGGLRRSSELAEWPAPIAGVLQEGRATCAMCGRATTEQRYQLRPSSMYVPAQVQVRGSLALRAGGPRPGANRHRYLLQAQSRWSLETGDLVVGGGWGAAGTRYLRKVP